MQMNLAMYRSQHNTRFLSRGGGGNRNQATERNVTVIDKAEPPSIVTQVESEKQGERGSSVMMMQSRRLLMESRVVKSSQNGRVIVNHDEAKEFVCQPFLFAVQSRNHG